MTPVILPPGGPAATPAISSAGHQAVLATVPDAPPAAARLEAGSIVTGTVIGRDAQGLVTLRTDKGVLALATNANLPIGSTVALEVRVAGARLQLVVLSVEPPPGQTGQPLPSAGTPPAAPPATAPQTPAAILAAALTGGSLVMATVVHATSGRAGATLAGPGGAPLPSASGTPPGPANGPTPPPGSQILAGQPAGQPAGAPLPGAQLPPGQVPAGSVSGTPSPALGAAPGTAGALPGQPATPSAAQSSAQSAVTALLTATATLEAELAALVAGRPAANFAGQPATPGGTTAAAPTPLPADGAHPAVLPTGPAATQPQTSPLPAQPPRDALPQPILPQQTVPQSTVPQASLPVGAEVGVRILGAALPGQPAPGADARPAGSLPLVTGTVIGQTPAGHPIVDTAEGRLVLAVKATLPAGTTLLLEIPPQTLSREALPVPAANPQQALLRLSQGWPALGNALAALGAAGDPAAAQALAARLPQSGPNLAAGLMTMIGQLAGGDAAEWLGPALREALGRVGRRELADRLRGEFQQLSRLASEPASGDWRVMFLPLRHEGELHQINLYLRGRGRNGKDGPDTGTRFIVEVDMTRLGPIQLDGLVHGRRFDLMLRSRVPLSATMRRDIEAIFEEARGITGFAGSIGFQIAQSFPVQPLAQAKRRHAAGGVVV